MEISRGGVGLPGGFRWEGFAAGFAIKPRPTKAGNFLLPDLGRRSRRRSGATRRTAQNRHRRECAQKRRSFFAVLLLLFARLVPRLQSARALQQELNYVRSLEACCEVERRVPSLPTRSACCLHSSLLLCALPEKKSKELKTLFSPHPARLHQRCHYRGSLLLQRASCDAGPLVPI